MADSCEVQALEKISTEVGESQIKITLSSQCIKAQAFLVDKLRKQSERQKEICSFISSNNLKLQTEIKQAELEIKSLIIAHEAIKSGNTELKKELLLAKVKKSEIAERVTNGEKKYEALWLESKERYESIPFVKKLLQATNKAQVLEETILALENQSRSLMNEYKSKKLYYANLDKKRIIELANYLINVLPNTNKIIREKAIAINEISKDIECIIKSKDESKGECFNTICLEQEQTSEEAKITKFDEGWMNISTSNERDTMLKIPRLQFINSDFDALNARLDQIKIMKVEIMNTPPLKRVNPTDTTLELCNKRVKDDEFSAYFNNHSLDKNTINKEKKDEKYSRRKLINILDDVKLDKNDAYNIVSKMNLDNLKGVTMIGTDTQKVEESSEVSNEKENEAIEEVDLTKSSTDKNNCSLLVPPSQFLDLTQDKLYNNSQQHVEVIVHMSMSEPSPGNMSQSLKTSQESINKKRVSFDLPLTLQEIKSNTNDNDVERNNINDINKADETMDSQIDISLACDESYSKIKDMILKKHNLDLSPQFTYAKNNIFQANAEHTVVTSKFFESEKCNTTNGNETNIEDSAHGAKESENKQIFNKEIADTQYEDDMDVDKVIVSSPKTRQLVNTDRSVTGLLFNHNNQGIPDSLNVSISTTGFEDGDADFPHCIDSSLLLSPKADLPMPMSGDNVDVTSQEVPNFLSGLRKTGLSFFGQPKATESKPDTSGQNQGNNFNFNFGGSDQKSRGGLFSMFR